MDSQRGPTLEYIEQMIHLHLLPNPEILNIYLFGSHLHQCATPTSDLDLMVVVGGLYFLGSKVWADEQETLNLSLFHREHIQDLISQNVIWIMMLKWIPPQYIWKCTHQFIFELKIPSLRNSVLQDASHNWAKAKRLWNVDGDFRKSKKNIIHGLRWLLFGEQIIKSGRIDDFTAGNEYWQQVMAATEQEWAYYEQIYRPIYKTLMHFIRHEALPGELHQEAPNEEFLKGIHKLETLAYVASRGISCLAFDYSLILTPITGQPHVIHVSIDKLSASIDYRIVMECNPLILDQSGDLKLLARGYPPFKPLDEIAEKQIRFPSLSIRHKLDGMLAILYYNASTSSWHVGTRLTADGSEYYSGEARELADGMLDGFKKNIKKFSGAKKWVTCDFDHKQGTDTTTTFRSLFWATWERKGYLFPATDFCYLFQLQHPYTNKVVLSKEHNIILHGVVDLHTASYCDVELHANKYQYQYAPSLTQFASLFLSPKSVHSYSIREELKKTVLALSPITCPGFVVTCTLTNTRYNLLSPQYVALRDMDPFNDPERNNRLMLDLVRVNQNHDFLQHFPQWVLLYTKVSENYSAFCKTVQNVFDEAILVSNQDFAKIANKYAFYGILFDMKKTKATNVRSYLVTQRLSWIMNIMKGYHQGKQRKDRKSVI